MNLFVKYKIPINILFLLFWFYIIYAVLDSEGFKIQKLIVPILFITLGIYNILDALKNNKTKSGD